MHLSGLQIDMYSVCLYYIMYSGTSLVRPPLLCHKCGLSLGVEFNIFMIIFIMLSCLCRGIGISSVWPLKRGTNNNYIYTLMFQVTESS